MFTNCVIILELFNLQITRDKEIEIERDSTTDKIVGHMRLYGMAISGRKKFQIILDYLPPSREDYKIDLWKPNKTKERMRR